MKLKSSLYLLYLFLFMSISLLAQPSISVDPVALNFSDVTVNEDSTLSVNINNNGDQELVVGLLDIIGPNADQFSISAGPTPPFSILPGAQPANLSITFSPTFFGTKFASLRIISNDPASDTLEILISGTGVEPDIDTDPDTVMFGEVQVGQNTTAAFNVFNIGGAPLEITGMTFSGTNASRFTLVDNFNFPLTIQPGGAPLAVNVRFTPNMMGPLTAALDISSNDINQPVSSVILEGIGVSPVLTLSPEDLDFGNVLVNDDSVITLAIGNDGNSDLVVSDTSLIGGGSSFFDVLNFPSGQIVIPPGGTPYGLEVQFSPDDVGSQNAFLILFTNDPNSSSKVISLTGNGAHPDIALSDTLIDFGTILVGSEVKMNLDISNTGLARLDVSNINIIGAHRSNYEITAAPGTPFSVTPGGTPASIEITFTPERRGLLDSALFSIVSNDPDENPLFVKLSGTGIEPDITPTDTLLNFSRLLVGRDSVKTVWLSNAGDADLIISNLTISGLGGNEYSIAAAPTLPATIPASSSDSVAIDVRFLPTSTGDKIASLDIVSNDPDENPLQIDLTGRGVLPEISVTPDPLDFGDVIIGSDSLQSFEIANVGGVPLVIDSLTITGADAGLFTLLNAPTLPITLAPDGDNIRLSVVFSPDSVGSKAAQFRIVNNDPFNNTLLVDILGNGVEPNILIQPNPVAFDSVRVNRESTIFVQVANDGSAPLILREAVLLNDFLAEFNFVREVELPVVINPGGEPLSISLRFIPKVLGLRTALLRFVSNDPDSSVFDVQVNGYGVLPEIAVENDTLDWGGAQVSVPTPANLNILNEGGAALTIDQFFLFGQDSALFAFDSLPPLPVVIAPDSFLAIPMTFTPDTLGERFANVRMITDDPDDPLFDVTLKGTGVFRKIAVSSDTLTFPGTATNSSSSAVLQILNDGIVDLRIDSIAVTGADSADFSATITGLPLTIPAGGVPVDVETGFAPLTKGQKTATLEIYSNDVINLPYRVTLNGRGLQPPSVSDISLSSARLNEDVNVSAIIVADTTIREVLIRYAASNSETLSGPDTLQLLEGSYQGAIPGSSVTQFGVKAVVEVTDDFGITTTSDPVFASVLIPAGTVNHAFETTSLNRWQIFSLPYQPTSGSIGEVLGDLGPDGDFTWRIYRTDSSGVNTNYHDKTALDNLGEYGQFASGNAFWLYVRNDDQGSAAATTVSFPEMSVIAADSFNYILQPGWNQIGSPYPFDVNWDQVDAVNKDSLEVYQWTGQAWSGQLAKTGWIPKIKTNFTMAPYSGIMVRNRTTAPITLTFHPQRSVAKTQLPKIDITADWQLDLVAETATSFDVNVIGMRHDAHDEQDYLDHKNLLSPDRNYVSLRFEREWNERSAAFSSDFRALNSEGAVWYFTLDGARRKANFYLRNAEALPENFRAVLVDAKYRRTYDLSGNAIAALRDLEKDETNRFALLVGSENFLNSEIANVDVFVPDDHQLLQNYPNPFNPETFIRFQLAESGLVTINIYNVLGQKVAALVDDFLAAGYYEKRWDGKDLNGRESASGVYFYRLSVNNFAKSMKMIKLK